MAGMTAVCSGSGGHGTTDQKGRTLAKCGGSGPPLSARETRKARKMQVAW